MNQNYDPQYEADASQSANYAKHLEKENASTWISVNDALPELGVYVLVTTPEYKSQMTVAKRDMVFKEEFVANALCITKQVTHWQHLPSLPNPTN